MKKILNYNIKYYKKTIKELTRIITILNHLQTLVQLYKRQKMCCSINTCIYISNNDKIIIQIRCYFLVIFCSLSLMFQNKCVNQLP